MVGFGDGFAVAVLISIVTKYRLMFLKLVVKCVRLLKRAPNTTKLFLSSFLQLAI